MEKDIKREAEKKLWNALNFAFNEAHMSDIEIYGYLKKIGLQEPLKRGKQNAN